MTYGGGSVAGRRVQRASAFVVAGALVALTTLPSRDSEAQLRSGGACHDGKVQNEDTAGHCCWEGQVWAKGKCVGVPRACPKGRSVDAGKEQCTLDPCPNGMTRPPNAATQCCWPGQAWSKLNGVCVGKPRCPKDFELRGETCADLAAEREARVKAAELAAQRERDERERAERQKREYEEEMRRQHELEAERARKAQEEEVERQRREAEAQRLAEQRRREQEHQDRLSAARAARLEKRDAGRVTLGFGVLGLAASGAFMGLGAVTNGNIHKGGFATQDDIASEANRGKMFNIVAGTFGAVGGVLVAVGIPLIVANPAPKDSDVAKSATPRMTFGLDASGASLRGVF